MPDTLIKIENLYKSYFLGNVKLEVLKNINIKIKKGEMITLIGKSGSGKSTLMNILGCLDIADSGKYYLDNIDVSKLNENKLAEIRNQKIGFVFQNFNLLPKLNALENVEMPLLYSGYSQAKEHAFNALKRVGLEDRIDHEPNQLSGGQRQRVAIARAIVTDPEIILADEPTGNLDTKTGIAVMEYFQKLNNEGKTILIVTHDHDISEYCQRSILIEDGRIV